MPTLTGNRRAKRVRPLIGLTCHWCNHAAIGYAQKSLGDHKPSCGSHGFAFKTALG